MKILHITEDFTENNYGVKAVVKQIHTYLLNNNITSKVLSPNTDELLKDIITTKKNKDNNNMWKYDNKFKNYIDMFDDHIIHIHGIWMYPQYIALKKTMKADRPNIVTLHGMLQEWLWSRNRFKYYLYIQLFLKKHFNKRTIIHAITEPERKNILDKIGSKYEIEIIPNLIEYGKVRDIALKSDFDNKEPYILYLGRADEIKGLNILLSAFSSISQNKIQLKIVCPINSYAFTLQNKYQSEMIKFVGPVYTDEKYKLFKNALAFITPSFSEVIGLVNLEAGACGTPVITTFQTGLSKQWNNKGGILINPKYEELKLAINEVINWSDNERNDRGRMLSEYVYSDYSWEKKGYKWLQLYERV